MCSPWSDWNDNDRVYLLRRARLVACVCLRFDSAVSPDVSRVTRRVSSRSSRAFFPRSDVSRRRENRESRRGGFTFRLSGRDLLGDGFSGSARDTRDGAKLPLAVSNSSSLVSAGCEMLRLLLLRACFREWRWDQRECPERMERNVDEGQHRPVNPFKYYSFARLSGRSSCLPATAFTLRSLVQENHCSNEKLQLLFLRVTFRYYFVALLLCES